MTLQNIILMVHSNWITYYNGTEGTFTLLSSNTDVALQLNGTTVYDGWRRCWLNNNSWLLQASDATYLNSISADLTVSAVTVIYKMVRHGIQT
jgi:hypothetical protein